MQSSLLLSNLFFSIFTYSEQAKDFRQLITPAAPVVFSGASLQVDSYFCTLRYLIACRNFHLEHEFKKKASICCMKTKLIFCNYGKFAIIEIIVLHLELKMYR